MADLGRDRHTRFPSPPFFCFFCHQGQRLRPIVGGFAPSSEKHGRTSDPQVSPVSILKQSAEILRPCVAAVARVRETFLGRRRLDRPFSQLISVLLLPLRCRVLSVSRPGAQKHPGGRLGTPLYRRTTFRFEGCSLLPPRAVPLLQPDWRPPPRPDTMAPLR